MKGKEKMKLYSERISLMQSLTHARTHTHNAPVLTVKFCVISTEPYIVQQI